MSKILKDLYYGEFRPFERKVLRTQENKALHENIQAEEQYFKDKLNADDCARFEALQNLYAISNSHEQEDAFMYGFKFATMLMSAVFGDGDKPISKI